MKPGDLVRIGNRIAYYSHTIRRCAVYDRGPDSEYFPRKVKWERGDLGVILDGRDNLNKMIQVLHKEKVVWVNEEDIDLLVNDATDAYDNNKENE